jgi:hypothetical protein
MRDEHAADVLDRDARLSQRTAKNGLGFRRVKARVDERVPGRALDQVRVDAPKGEWERQLDAPDARRDDRRGQRWGSFARVIAGRMVISRPVRLVA